MRPRLVSQPLALIMLGSLAVASAATPVDEVLPVRTEHAIVYATPIKNAVILEFKLYDNKTWCWLYLRKETWDAIRANGGELPNDMSMGQLQCERR